MHCLVFSFLEFLVFKIFVFHFHSLILLSTHRRMHIITCSFEYSFFNIVHQWLTTAWRWKFMCQVTVAFEIHKFIFTGIYGFLVYLKTITPWPCKLAALLRSHWQLIVLHLCIEIGLLVQYIYICLYICMYECMHLLPTSNVFLVTCLTACGQFCIAAVNTWNVCGYGIIISIKIFFICFYFVFITFYYFISFSTYNVCHWKFYKYLRLSWLLSMLFDCIILYLYLFCKYVCM